MGILEIYLNNKLINEISPGVLDMDFQNDFNDFTFELKNPMANAVIKNIKFVTKLDPEYYQVLQIPSIIGQNETQIAIIKFFPKALFSVSDEELPNEGAEFTYDVERIGTI